MAIEEGQTIQHLENRINTLEEELSNVKKENDELKTTIIAMKEKIEENEKLTADHIQRIYNALDVVIKRQQQKQ